MILSDIIHSEVFDNDGAKLGYVVDVRFVVDGAPGQLLAGAALHSLLVSPRTGSTFLGYERTGSASPWPIGALLARRHRGSFFVTWEDIAVVDDARVRLRANFVRIPLA